MLPPFAIYYPFHFLSVNSHTFASLLIFVLSFGKDCNSYCLVEVYIPLSFIPWGIHDLYPQTSHRRIFGFLIFSSFLSALCGTLWDLTISVHKEVKLVKRRSVKALYGYDNKYSLKSTVFMSL